VVDIRKVAHEWALWRLCKGHSSSVEQIAKDALEKFNIQVQGNKIRRGSSLFFGTRRKHTLMNQIWTPSVTFSFTSGSHLHWWPVSQRRRTKTLKVPFWTFEREQEQCIASSVVVE
jgi:hypothetical protein